MVKKSLAINPKLIANSDELKRIFEEQLPLGKVQVIDVQNFLREQGFSFSDLYRKDERAFKNSMEG